ncbi:MAG: VCBS repeat-containing protein, partial [Chitinophagaceae bacterium]
YLGASKTHHGTVMVQQASGKFLHVPQPDMERDSMYEDVDAVWADMNNDGYKDLVIASGGNEFYGNDKHMSPRLYFNDGKNQLVKQDSSFSNLFLTASSVVAADFNGDGSNDLFIGGRAVPWEYGEIPTSYLLQNDGTGKFTDVTEKLAPGLSKAGMVTSAAWYDMDKDGDPDLIIACEWGGIEVFLNTTGRFSQKSLTTKKGWWNFILPVDVNNDGQVDIIAGNLGLNSRLTASPEEPVSLYYNDFDGNGKKEQVLTYYVGKRELPFVNKDELQKKVPFIKKKFLYAGDFAKASIADIFGDDKLKKAQVLQADYFSNAVLINKGNMEFSTVALPWQAQLTSFRDAVVINANDDMLPDFLLVGNYYSNNIQMGRYDADFGTILLNTGNGNFRCENAGGLVLKGQSRRIRPMKMPNRTGYILARNNDSVVVLSGVTPVGNK